MNIYKYINILYIFNIMFNIIFNIYAYIYIYTYIINIIDILKIRKRG